MLPVAEPDWPLPELEPELPMLPLPELPLPELEAEPLLSVPVMRT